MNFRLKPSLRQAVPAAFLAASAGLAGCSSDSSVTDPETATTQALQSKVKNIVVIYAENRSFDNLYGNFPGANGLSTVVDANGVPLAAYAVQKDRDGTTTLPTLPPTWGGVTASGQTPVVTQEQSTGLANAPFAINTAFGADLNSSVITRDLYHRFYENQMEIDGGKNDMFAAWADAGGLTMGHYNDTTSSELYALAQQYVLADNFFEGAFGGSFLNHQYLICACAPEYPNADTAPQQPSISVLNTDSQGNYLPFLTPASDSPASALAGPPKYVRSGNLTPKNYFGDGTFHAINTMQPAYQPSGNSPVDTSGTDALYADPGRSTTLPPQTETTIGDQLTAKGISWKWYSGAWNAALADGEQAPGTPHSVIYAPSTPGVGPNFQPHHQPFNYYQNFDPVAHADTRAEHLKDYSDLTADIQAGTLPAVTFYKPEGDLNQHEGYASVTAGDQHIANLVAQLQASPQWKNMVIVITYDEFGGVWDHVAPPKADLLGPGTRIPALIISPFAKKGLVDHTQYDTDSVLRLIDRRYAIDPLPGLTTRDNALVANGGKAMGDLTAALKLN